MAGKVSEGHEGKPLDVVRGEAIGQPQRDNSEGHAEFTPTCPDALSRDAFCRGRYRFRADAAKHVPPARCETCQVFKT